MPNLSPQLILDRCPHCAIANPNLNEIYRNDSHDHEEKNRRFWVLYLCNQCGGMVIASAKDYGRPILEIFPSRIEISNDVPNRAKNFLEQSVASIHAPAGAVMLAASSVDAMLKEKGYKDGSLYERIEKAVKEHLLAPEMVVWAHEVRLDANDQRHADEESVIPSSEDAKKVVDFTKAIAEYLFVLPARIQRGLGDNPPKSKSKK
ncbi:MAG: DUF4145 domain-containing protein [Candidatus Neomarinimicrobiota bacterium]